MVVGEAGNGKQRSLHLWQHSEQSRVTLAAELLLPVSSFTGNVASGTLVASYLRERGVAGAVSGIVGGEQGCCDFPVTAPALFLPGSQYKTESPV